MVTNILLNLHLYVILHSKRIPFIFFLNVAIADATRNRVHIPPAGQKTMVSKPVSIPITRHVSSTNSAGVSSKRKGFLMFFEGQLMVHVSV